MKKALRRNHLCVVINILMNIPFLTAKQQEEIFALPNVEQSGPNQKFHFNCGTAQIIIELQSELARNGVNNTVVCTIHGDMAYYTPKYAEMGPNATWVKME